MRNNKLMIAAAIVFGVFSFAINSFGQSDGSEQNKTGKAGTFAITNVRIVPVTGPVIESGTVVIQNGKIAAVGASASIPGGAERIDGKGLSIYPGMIDADTALGLDEIGQGANGTVDVSETGSINPNAKAFLGVNPNTSHVNVTRVNGVTTVASLPRGGLISGQSTVINLNGRRQEDMALDRTNALVINFPRVAIGGFGGFGGFRPQVDFSQAVKRRDEQVDELKKLFIEAQNYGRAVDARAKDPSLPEVATDLKLEAMVPYVRGEKSIAFLAERERDIRAVAKFIEETKVKGFIVGGQDAWKAADVLKKDNIGVVYTNIYNLPVEEDDPYDSLYSAPSKLAAAGVRFAISTGDVGAGVRDLPYQAGLAGAYGLSHDDALKSVTLYAAQILGVDDRIGSIEVGKDANLVVADGDILEPRTNIKYLFIGGRLLPLTSRHTELFDSFKDVK